MELQEKYRVSLVRGAELMIENGLRDWTVKLQNKRSTLADCSNYKKTIRYSRHFLKVATKEQLEGVTLHEIAHALVGHGHAHDSVFKEKCKEIGADIKYHGHQAVGVRLPYKYTLTCPECGGTSRSNKKGDFICGRCDDQGKKIDLIFTENPVAVVAW